MALAGRQRATAATAGDPTVNPFRPSFDFDEMIERVAIGALEMNWCRFGHSRPTARPSVVRFADPGNRV